MIQKRWLRSDDTDRLAAYFETLSPLTRSRYGPHPFTPETAAAICAGLESDPIVRLVGTVGEGSDETIIAYFLLLRGVWEFDQKRYDALGIPLDPATDATLAPSVSDPYHDQGIGSAMMAYTLEQAIALGRKRLVLWYGVQATNERAVHFYTKWGFRKVGTFFTDKDNFDMIRELP